MKKSINRIGGALITLLMVAGVFLATSATAQAQYRQYPDGHVRQDRRDRDGDGDYDQRDAYIIQQQRNGGYGTYGNNGGYGTYGRNDGYGNDGYNQAALNQGYQNGLNTGARDAERGQSYNPQRSHFYKEASSQAFREGFMQGYDQGYRQYAGGNNGGYRRNNGGIGNILGGILGRP